MTEAELKIKASTRDKEIMEMFARSKLDSYVVLIESINQSTKKNQY